MYLNTARQRGERERTLEKEEFFLTLTTLRTVLEDWGAFSSSSSHGFLRNRSSIGKTWPSVLKRYLDSALFKWLSLSNNWNGGLILLDWKTSLNHAMYSVSDGTIFLCVVIKVFIHHHTIKDVHLPKRKTL